MTISLLDLLRKRRSIRQFTRQVVEPEKVDTLIEAAVRTPTSRGRNPWEFIVVTDPEALVLLGKAKANGSGFIAKAPLAIVFSADTTISNVWIEDCSIAAMMVQMTAEELGLGSCWAQIRLRPHNLKCSAGDYIKELLNIPATHAIECVVGIGYAAEEKSGHPVDVLPFDRVHREKYGRQG